MSFNYDKIRGVKKECPICGKLIGITAFNRHVKSCERIKKKLLNKDACKQINGKYKCPICDREFTSKRSLGQHYSFCSGKKIIWNKGLTANNDKRVEKCSIKLKEHYKKTNIRYGFCDSNFLKSDYHTEYSRKGGLISASINNKRSKNEIYFADLLKEYGFEITCNENFFDDWDADIILHKFKIAILWNGIWHYKKVRKNHNLNQVQSRDKIKINKIKSFGYTVYIIKDMGRYNIKFVNEKFDEFINYLKCNNVL